MKKVLLYSVLLVVGLVGSQFLPTLLGDALPAAQMIVRLLTTVALGFIMIHVGLEFDLDRTNLRKYGVDYGVAMTAAAFPWLFAAGYFVLVMFPEGSGGSWQAWKEALLAGRFAAPTSAGVLFSMLAAAGLGATWVFGKARILAIFDDLDTVLLMVVLKAFIVGFVWQLGVVIGAMVVMLWVAWRWMRAVGIPASWPWVIGYSVAIVGASEAVYAWSREFEDAVPIHIEVLLPAFVLGVMIRKTEAVVRLHDEPGEKAASGVLSAAFMVLVGLSMPAVFGGATSAASPAAASEMISAQQPMPGWGTLALHVLVVTVLSNVGKMFPAFCYRREATFRERLALAIGMWPRGEVGAGVLVVSLSYGLGGPVITVAMLSLALNLLLTGVFIAWVKKLLGTEGEAHSIATA
jgi:Kef-type K+ transport system membrane component KefB